MEASRSAGRILSPRLGVVTSTDLLRRGCFYAAGFEACEGWFELGEFEVLGRDLIVFAEEILALVAALLEKTLRAFL